MRKRLPFCPFCRNTDGSRNRMHPQIMEDSSIRYVCTNPHCQAMAPVAKTYREAMKKAADRAEMELQWHDRDTLPPDSDGEYLCEYAYFWEDSDRAKIPKQTYCAVKQWDELANRFTMEGERTFTGSMCVVLRWADIGRAATQMTSGGANVNEMKVRVNSETARRVV